MSIKMEVWGEYACFTRPEMKVERVSYDVPTPSAARGMVESVYYHPGLKWHVDKIYVCKPIRFTNILRNEVASKISASNVLTEANGKKRSYIDRNADIQQRATTMLRNVHYVIEAHFEMTDKANPSDNPGKFQDIIRRRLDRGQCYHTPYFGCREFPAGFRRFTGGRPETAYPDETKDLGYMLYDMDYSDPKNITPTFFRAKLVNGVLDLRNCEVVR